MFRRLCLFWAALVLTAGPSCFAQELRVEYLYGRLEVAEAGRWREALSGEPIPCRATLRLGEKAVAELSCGSSRITLSQPGIYAATELLRAHQESTRWGLPSLVAEKLRLLFNRPAARSLSSLGIRGEESVGEQGISWMEEEKEAFDKARQLLAEGGYAEAAKPLEKLLESAVLEDKSQCLYLLGCAYFLAGRSGPALQALEQARPPHSAPYFADFALIKSRLLVEGHSYQQALELLDAALNLSPGVELAQPAWFLSAYCAQQLGDPASARQRLIKAQALDPGSDIGSQAAMMLKDLSR